MSYNGKDKEMTCTDIIKESPEFCFQMTQVEKSCDRACIEAGLAYGECSIIGLARARLLTTTITGKLLATTLQGKIASYYYYKGMHLLLVTISPWDNY